MARVFEVILDDTIYQVEELSRSATTQPLPHQLYLHPCHKCASSARFFCPTTGGPSERPTWAVFRTFVRLLSHQLEKVERYPLLSAEVAQRTLNEHGLETFR